MSYVCSFLVTHFFFKFVFIFFSKLLAAYFYLNLSETKLSLIDFFENESFKVFYHDYMLIYILSMSYLLKLSDS